MQATRRQAIRTALNTSVVLGLDAVVPRCLLQAANSISEDTETILVVVQLSGGNDGLNTVIPFANETYRSVRPTLAVSESEVLKVNDELGLHPSLRGMADLLEDGQLCIVQGVGYDNPNRSHFESMDVWHSCTRDQTQRSDGWLGRILDQFSSARKPQGNHLPALHLGTKKQPLALRSENVLAPSVRSIEEFRLKSDSPAGFRNLVQELATSASSPVDSPTKKTESSESLSRLTDNSLLNFLDGSTSSALLASRQVEDAVSAYQTAVEYPDNALASKLKIVAQLIDSGIRTRIYYVELDGFDTHARQANTHAILLREWSDSVSAFVRDLNSHDHGERVCVMSFSEFGRRVAENASGGTDHGAAAPMILAGAGLQSGIVGEHPDLSDLNDGDLKHSIDFRQVYATLVRDWLAIDPLQIVGQEFASLRLMKQPA